MKSGARRSVRRIWVLPSLSFPSVCWNTRCEFRRDTDYVINNLTGLDLLEYSLDAGREGGITDPGYLRLVDDFANWYREQPGVSHVQAFPDIMKRLNKKMPAPAPHLRLSHGSGNPHYNINHDRRDSFGDGPRESIFGSASNRR